MKFTLVALIGALCLVAANAGTIAQVAPLELEIAEYMPGDMAEVDTASFSIFSSFYWVAKAALKTLKGMNCTIKEVIAIRDSCLNFLADIQSCGADVSAQVQAVITLVNKIITICNNIITMNTSVCGNAAPSNASEDFVVYSTRTGWTCFWKMLSQILSLQNQIQSTISAIKNLPADTSNCVLTATNTLSSAFTSFPANIKTCSKLTSN